MTIGHGTSKVSALTDSKEQKGSASSDSDEQSPDAFRDIPFDVKDHILSLIDSPRDLLALSLTSQEWSAMILPVHIRYRELRIRGNQPEIWQHLATRADLSKNIRKVCLMRPNDRRDQILSLTLNRAHRVTDTERIHPHPDMIRALSHFKSLTSFTWLESSQHGQFTEEIFSALANCHELVELILGGVPRKACLNPESSIWRIRNLRILLFNEFDWVLLGDTEDSFISMLDNSPDLEDLAIPYNYSSVKFTSCRFRHLIKLRLSVVSNIFTPFLSNDVFQAINKPIIDFLFAHPTIQALSWYPSGQLPDFLPQGLLPTLKHLYSHYPLTTALLRDNTVIKSRMLETILEMSLDLNTMQSFGTINGSRLQQIHLFRCDESYNGIETIRRLSVLSPMIKTIGIVGRGMHLSAYKLDEYIDCFGEFPLLENLYDGAIWGAIWLTSNTEKKEEIIRKLYTRCSALKTLRADMLLKEEIVFFRDGLDVTWKLQAVKKL